MNSCTLSSDYSESQLYTPLETDEGTTVYPSFTQGSAQLPENVVKAILALNEQTSSDATNSTDNEEWIATLENLNKSISPNTHILDRRAEIRTTREKFRPFIEAEKALDPLYVDMASLSMNILRNGTYQFQSLIPVGEGISGTYFLVDANEIPQFVLKPFDEEAGCINNPKFYVGITAENPVRDNMPLYHSAMREVLAYQVALKIGVDSIAPQTVLAIIQADQFHDLSDALGQTALKELVGRLDHCGPADREKLCSAQRYVPDSVPLYKAVMDLQMTGLTDQEIAERFDQTDFEDMNILLWTTYDTDGHFGNILAYPKGIDSMGNKIFGLKKIDNGLSFPDKNQQLRNNLIYLENACKPLSISAKEKIASIPLDALVEQCKIYGLDSAIPALKERVPFLQQIVKIPGITVEEINDHMSKIGGTL